MNTIKFLILFFTLTSFSNVLAILDSGVDYKHTELIDKMWTNPNEVEGNRRDDDKNGYRDDFYGWNFASSTGEIINYDYLGTFSKDPHRLFKIQAEILSNGFPSSALGCYCSQANPKCSSIDYGDIYANSKLVEDDFKWICSKRSDKKFNAEMGKFGNFIHGTHVAHIASRLSPESKVMGLKLIPTEIGEVQSWMLNVFKQSYKTKKYYTGEAKNKDGARDKALKTLLSSLAGMQTGMLVEAFNYIKDQKVSVVNGSFGTPFEGIKMFSDNAFKVIFFRKPTKEESDKYARHYFSVQLEILSKSIANAKDTLWVFASGNSASNNDLYPSSPTNIDLPNVISVAATLNYSSLASFSNYGSKMVDVGAPGVVIKAAIPSQTHDEFIQVSGTSQASPFVAGVAAKIRMTNNKLTPAEVKKIIVSTIDEKDFMNGKTKHAGVVNNERAVHAAELSLSNELDKAIGMAKSKINDRPSTMSKSLMSKAIDATAGYMPDLTHDKQTQAEMNELISKMATQMVQRLK